MGSAWMIGVEVVWRGDEGQAEAHSRSSTREIGVEGLDQPVRTSVAVYWLPQLLVLGETRLIRSLTVLCCSSGCRSGQSP